MSRNDAKRPGRPTDKAKRDAILGAAGAGFSQFQLCLARDLFQRADTLFRLDQFIGRALKVQRQPLRLRAGLAGKPPGRTCQSKG